MNVVFRINGREAIPVRAIPYMAETTISADVLVRGFSRIDPTHSLYGLSAHKLLDYGVPYPMAREEWRRFAVNLQALSDSLDRLVSNGELTFVEATAKWKRESVKVLPAGVFVWKDEFQAEHSQRFRRLSDDEIVANRAHWIEATTELIASPDDSYTAELMAANGAPENWRAVLQDGIDEMAAEEPFNPRQFFVYAPNWSSAKASDSPVDVTYDPMIDRDETDAVVEGFAGFLTDDQTTDNAPMAHAEGGGEITQMLALWFDKPIGNLPRQLREIAEAYIPNWSELSGAERQARADEADHQVQTTLGDRFEKARMDAEHANAATPARFAQRDRKDGFDKVEREKKGERDFEAKRGAVNLTDERCIELAHSHELRIADWTALTGIGIGLHRSYLVKTEGVAFRNWTEREIREASVDQQVEMQHDNEAMPLTFPCMPATLIQFVDAAPLASHSFSVPDAFRRAVSETAPPTDTPALVAAQSREQTSTTCSEAQEVAPAADEQGEATTLEQEQATGHDTTLADLFNAVKVPQLEAMFPDDRKWKNYAERANRNGLKCARTGRGEFNPYLAAKWWIDSQGPVDWKWERCMRVLANNLPARSRDSKHLLTGKFD